jgi:primosomal protein N' (replication factor Y)
MLKFVQIYIEHRQLKLNQAYTYLAPISAQVGMRVEVQFNTQVCIGFIVQCEDFSETKQKAFSDQDIEIKEVLRVIDTEAVLTQELIDLGFWMANETISPVISCFQVMLPKVKRISSSYQDAQLERWVHLIKIPEKCTKNQLELVEELAEDCLMNKIKGSKYTLDTMIKNGFIEVYTKEKTYQNQTYIQKLPDYELSDKQKNALDIIHTSDKDIMCLFGKTGSGKTELYLKLAEEALKQGKQSLICVPEIALT